MKRKNRIIAVVLSLLTIWAMMPAVAMAVPVGWIFSGGIFMSPIYDYDVSDTETLELNLRVNGADRNARVELGTRKLTNNGTISLIGHTDTGTSSQFNGDSSASFTNNGEVTASNGKFSFGKDIPLVNSTNGAINGLSFDFSGVTTNSGIISATNEIYIAGVDGLKAFYNYGTISASAINISHRGILYNFGKLSQPPVFNGASYKYYDLALKTLEIYDTSGTAISLTESFLPEKRDYVAYTTASAIKVMPTLTSTSGIAGITVSAISAADNSVISSDEAVTDGTSSSAINISSGAAIIKIEIRTDETPATVNTYTITVGPQPPAPVSRPSGYSHSVNATAGEGGKISPEGQEGWLYGKDKTYEITPDEGYAIDEVIVDGVSVGALRTYTFTNVSGRHTIKAVFRKLTELEIAENTLDKINIKAASKAYGKTAKHKRYIKVTWNQINIDGQAVTGYQVSRKIGKTGKYYNTFKTTGLRYLSNKNLKTGKYAYYRVRPYIKLDDGSMVYGDWSKATIVKVK